MSAAATAIAHSHSHSSKAESKSHGSQLPHLSEENGVDFAKFGGGKESNPSSGVTQGIGDNAVQRADSELISLSPKRTENANANTSADKAFDRRNSRSALSYSMSSSSASSHSRSRVGLRRLSFADEVRLNFDGKSSAAAAAAADGNVAPPREKSHSSSTVCSCNSSSRLRQLGKSVDLHMANGTVQKNIHQNDPASGHDPAGEFSGADRHFITAHSRNSSATTHSRNSSSTCSHKRTHSNVLKPPSILYERQGSSHGAVGDDVPLSLSMDDTAAAAFMVPPFRRNSTSSNNTLRRFDSLRNLGLRTNSLRPMQTALLTLVRDLGFPGESIIIVSLFFRVL